MEKKLQEQPSENLQVAKFDPSVVYANASKLQLSESEMKALSAPFDDDEYEIRSDGYIYIPQVLTLQRLNQVIGIGKWSLLLINNGKDEIAKDQYKVFYDGAMVIRDCFVSRSVGEAQYSRNNKNQSWASAFEAAKSDCRQRCCKDLGIANDAWNPSFIRRWQKEHAIKVFVEENGQKKTVWRRKDLDPFYNETGPVPSYVPGVATEGQQSTQPNKQLPWLNHGPEYDIVLRKLHNLETTLPQLFNEYRIAKKTEEAIKTVLIKEWKETVSKKNTLVELTELYNGDEAWLKAHPFIIEEAFKPRRAELQKVAA